MTAQRGGGEVLIYKIALCKYRYHTSCKICISAAEVIKILRSILAISKQLSSFGAAEHTVTILGDFSHNQALNTEIRISSETSVIMYHLILYHKNFILQPSLSYDWR